MILKILKMIMEGRNMENKENDIFIELYDESKHQTKYKLLDIVLYENSEYAVMIQEPTSDNLVEIFKMQHSEDKTKTIYKPESNNYIIMQVYETFKEKYQKYYSNRIKFND